MRVSVCVALSDSVCERDRERGREMRVSLSVCVYV